MDRFKTILKNLSLDASASLLKGKYTIALTPWELEHFIKAFLYYTENNKNINVDFFERPLIEDLRK